MTIVTHKSMYIVNNYFLHTLKLVQNINIITLKEMHIFHLVTSNQKLKSH